MKNYVQQARSLRRNIYMKTRLWKNLRPHGTKHEIDGKIDGKIGIEIENETKRIVSKTPPGFSVVSAASCSSSFLSDH